MIKAKIGSSLFLGFSEDNLRHLKTEEFATIPLSDVGAVAELTNIILCYKETETEVARVLYEMATQRGE